MSTDPIDRYDPRPGQGRPLRELLTGHLQTAVQFDMTPMERFRCMSARSNADALHQLANPPREGEPPPTDGEKIAAAAFAAALRPGGDGVAFGPQRVLQDVAEDLRKKGHDANVVAAINAARPDVVERIGREMHAEQEKSALPVFDAMKASREDLAAYRRRGGL